MRVIAWLAKNTATEIYCSPHGFKRIGGKFLWHQADVCPCGPVVVNDVLTVSVYRSCAGIDDTADDIDQCSFARAVRAEQGEDFAATYVEVDSF